MVTARLNAAQTLDREFLEIRRRLIDIAASLDRIDRAGGADAVSSDSRVSKVQEAVHILADGQPDRASRMQMAFSDEYEDGWRGQS